MIPAFLWGTTYSATQLTLVEWPPLLLGVLRALPAGLLLLLIKPTLPTASTWKHLLLIGFINIGVFFCLIFIMAQTLPSALSSVGMMGIPVVAMIMQWIIYRRKPTPLKVVCAITLVVIAWILFNPGSLQLSSLGLVAMAAAMICILTGSMLTQNLGQTLHWWALVTWQLIFGGLTLIPVMLIHASTDPSSYLQAIQSVSTNNIVGFLWISGLNTAVGYGLYVWLIQRMSIVDFTFGGFGNPIAGITCGVMLMNESYSTTQYALMTAMVITSLLPQLLNTKQVMRPQAISHQR